MSTNVILLFILEALNRVVGEEDSSQIASEQALSSTSQTGTAASQSDNFDNPPYTVYQGDLFSGEFERLDATEERFWTTLIAKYLRPVDPQDSEAHQQRLNRQMRRLRNDATFAFMFLNGLWLAIMAALQEVKEELVIVVQDGDKRYVLQPMGLFFIGVFCVLLLLQILAMFRHR